jgi:hypothetical protein
MDSILPALLRTPRTCLCLRFKVSPYSFVPWNVQVALIATQEPNYHQSVLHFPALDLRILMRFLHFRQVPQLQEMGRPPRGRTRAAFIALAASLTVDDLGLRFKCNVLK